MRSCCNSRDTTVSVFLTRAFSGPHAVIPESSLSSHSNLSVPSNPAQSTQLQSSYNPFEDEDDTGSSVSEKEDIKAKKLVNTHFPLASTSLSVSPLYPGVSWGLTPQHFSSAWVLQDLGVFQTCWDSVWPLHLSGRAQLTLFFGCFFSVLC